MKAYSIPALIIASICLTIALSDMLAWIRRNKKNSNMAFILICLGGVSFCLFCAGEYSVDTSAQSLFWLKGEVIASTISGFALLWFIAEATQLIKRQFIVAGLVWTGLSVLTQIFDLGDLAWVASQPFTLRVDLPFGLHFVYREVARGPVLIVIDLVGFFLLNYLFWTVIKFRRLGNRRESTVLFFALGFIIFAQIMDFIIGIGLLSWVFLLEYAWLATILVVGLNRSNDFIEAAITRKALATTDQELKVSQTMLSTIIDSTADMIWSVEKETFYLLTYNQNFRDHFQQANGVAVYPGLEFVQLLASAEERSQWTGLYRKCLAEGDCAIELESLVQARVYWVNINQLRRGDNVFGLSVFAEDITERKIAERRVSQALKEKEVLIQEIYHRTKNNMNVIISILKLQSNQVGDARLKEAFAVSIDRIITMSLVHDKLYQSKDLSHIDLQVYIQDLVKRLLANYAFPSNPPALMFAMESVFVLIETAIHCGMIVNELVTNALKYAFVPNHGGEIRVGLQRDGQSQIQLTISDNGVGLPVGFDEKRDGHLGMRLIQSLAQGRLQAQLEFSSDEGVCWKMKFSDPEAVFAD